MNKLKKYTFVLSALMVLLVLLIGCVEKGDHGNMKQIELLLKDGGTITLACPEFDRQPLGAHGRECYIKAN